VKTAIHDLKNTSQRSEISWSRGLSNAAQVQANYLGERGHSDHSGFDRSQLQDRVEKYGEFSGDAVEIIEFAAASAEEVI
jgi:uncharacterized protein YkwD